MVASQQVILNLFRLFHPLNRLKVYSNAEWLEGLVNKDEEVIRAVYLRHFEKTRRLILMNQGGEEDARDVFQEVLIAVFLKAQAGTLILSSSFGAYLYSVSRLLWLRELKRRRRLTSFPENAEGYPESAGDCFDRICARDQLLIFRKHFEDLSEDCRKVLLLFQEGYSIAEITRLMGFRSEQHTRNRRYRCKMCLFRKIRDFYRLST